MQMKDFKNIYFIGIGGIGMSALARFFKRQGQKVSGYDKTVTTLTKKLESEGIEIMYEDRVDLLPKEVDLVIYTPAIPSYHKGLLYFRNKGITMMKRSEVLGAISRSSRCIAVGGTHGKTTTSALITHLLENSGLHFSAFIGGLLLPEYRNYIGQGTEWVIVEADEYDRSFLQLHPDIAVLISMDSDHLDIYGMDNSVKAAFWEFVCRIRNGGLLLFRTGLEVHFPPDWQKQLEKRKITCRSFGVDAGIVHSNSIEIRDKMYVFTFNNEADRMDDLRVSLPGRHNIENATAAIEVALHIGISKEKIRNALGTFKGIFRRFEKLWDSEDVVYIDDYAHHPRELEAAIQTTRELYPGKIITGIFQPHLYSRTRDFATGFASALDLLDKVILMPIYPARELPIPGVTSKMIGEKMKEPPPIYNHEEVLKWAERDVKGVILTLGAGNIDLLREPLTIILKEINK
ncbi:MAG TPA: UDP-N-acetylmuramate--L-alanine ligase [Saprospiraceae bacterium]|nr:UDP-N-acetylmuramate--L-alanine ligase [Saprospiraceae bacterium]